MGSQALFDLTPIHPGKILSRMMEEKGWTPEEVAAITGLSGSMVYSLIRGSTNIGAETAVKLAAAFGNQPEEWLKWDSLFRLSQLEQNGSSSVSKLARLYELAPIRDMQKRGWIAKTKDVDELESELKRFFGRDSLEGDMSFPVATKRSFLSVKLNPAEKAWCFCARQLASTIPLPKPFNPKRLEQAEKKLRQLAAFRKLAGHLSDVLLQYGIRFVVVEPIPGVRIDGATFWLDSEPVIAMSIRHDRIDGFWFTLMHEFAHVKRGDASVDSDLIDGTKGVAYSLVEDEAEQAANESATASLVPPDEMQSFIRRVGPLYPRERVIQFAHKIKIHPGIIVGQLQHRNELGYMSLRDLLVKVRDVIISTAFTDGWNQSVAPAILRGES
jgi:HTH-type transcriptional regulator / antitoxin HigA